MDVSYKFSAFGGTPPRRVRDGDPHGRRLRHGGSVFGGNSLPRKYSPTRLEYFVRNHRPAGARPDPAGQYANPYTYGGDPVNYVDPAGLFSFDTGLLTIGWTSSQGRSIGLESGPFSYSWNQDGSTSFNAGVSGSYQYYIFNFSGSLGYSYNSYSGHTLGVDGSACVGTKEGDDYAACAGVEAGGSEYWDGYGNYLGATAYAGAFAELSGGEDNSLKGFSGYEAGFLGMEGRGVYAGVSAGADGGSLYAQWSENGGWSYGFGQSFTAWKYEKDGDLPKWEILGGVLRSGDGEIFSADGAYYDDNGGDPLNIIFI